MDEIDLESGESESENIGLNGVVQFGLSVVAEPGLIQRIFKRVDTRPEVASVNDSLRILIESNAQITDVEWLEV